MGAQITMSRKIKRLKKYLKCFVKGHDLVKDEFHGDKATVGKNSFTMKDFNATQVRCVECGMMINLEVYGS